ncbi:hypothetical protein RvY_15273 [Ramazzottius varieornatus]|uniref:Uncharacterized protein n=1 Tax=Ramazzottius varieornatus TaxID=947166 RepID=A0A1D1VXR6_RAMVA|nr:hypothetical protein RvY_15273 [Ramazzottius varieornatus]
MWIEGKRKSETQKKGKKARKAVSEPSDASIGTPNAETPKARKLTAGWKRDSRVRNFFKYDDDEADYSVCTAERCSVKLAGSNARNNRVHMLKHPKLYQEYLDVLAIQKAEKQKRHYHTPYGHSVRCIRTTLRVM